MSYLGIDKAIVYVLASKGWNILSGVCILLLISKFLTVEQQGYYFTFSSILGMQVLFELGFGSIIIQFISHEAPNLKFSRVNGALSVSGDNIFLFRFFSIIRLSMKWYFIVGLLMLFVVLPAGIVFFSSKLSVLLNLPLFFVSESEWLFPWLTLVFCAIFALTVTPVLSIAEGCGYVAEVARVRLIQSIFNALIALSLLVSDYSLYSVASSLFSLFIVGGWWGYKNFYLIICSAFKLENKSNSFFSWRKEMLPVQWRIAVSWLSGFFIYQLFNPVAFKVYGPEFAGRLGMSITVCNMLLNLSISWIMTKVPRFGNLISTGQRDEVLSLYKNAFNKSLIFLCILIFLGIVLIFVCEYIGLFFVKRVLSPWVFICMLMTVLGNHIVICQATFVRSHKRELYMVHSLLSAMLSTFLLALSPFITSNSLVIGYSLIIFLFAVPYGFYIYRKFVVTSYVINSTEVQTS